MEIQSLLSTYREKTNRQLQAYRTAKQRTLDEKREAGEAKQNFSDVMEAQVILQNLAQHLQQQAHKQIASVVTRCLESVFDDPYQFKIIFERKRGKTEARLIFIRKKEELHPRSGAGGGCIDVASFALRLACIMLQRPAVRRCLIMDEPFKNVHSPIYRERVRMMLETLSKEMSIQFIMSTGCDDFHCGKVIEIT